MRLINRKWVIKSIEHCLDEEGCDCSDCYYDNQGGCFHDLLRDVLVFLKEQPKQKFFVDGDGKMTPLPIQPQWISVDDRLPEACTGVLVTSKGRYVYISYIVHGEWEYGGEPTHWMPLPEPPKEESDD